MTRLLYELACVMLCVTIFGLSAWAALTFIYPIFLKGIHHA